MQTQKDKIPADISQIPQEILKSYDRFRFCRYLFFGALLTFLIYIVVFLTFVHNAPIMSFLCMLALSAINILVCLNRLKYKKYALLLFISDADKAFMLIWIPCGCDILRPLCFNRILFTDKISHRLGYTSDYTRYFYRYFGGDNNI